MLPTGTESARLVPNKQIKKRKRRLPTPVFDGGSSTFVEVRHVPFRLVHVLSEQSLGDCGTE
jgi:hypothetical protein